MFQFSPICHPTGKGDFLDTAAFKVDHKGDQVEVSLHVVQAQPSCCCSIALSSSFLKRAPKGRDLCCIFTPAHATAIRISLAPPQVATSPGHFHSHGGNSSDHITNLVVRRVRPCTMQILGNRKLPFCRQHHQSWKRHRGAKCVVATVHNMQHRGPMKQPGGRSAAVCIGAVAVSSVQNRGN